MIAWTTPAVIAMSSLPAMAVSGYYVGFTPLGVGCKLPGASCQQEVGVKDGYIVRVKICTNVPEPISIQIEPPFVYVNGVKQATAATVKPNPVLIPMNATPTPGDPTQRCVFVDVALDMESSANVSLWGKTGYTWKSTKVGSVLPGGSGTLIMCAPDTPPCDVKLPGDNNACHPPQVTSPSADCPANP